MSTLRMTTAYAAGLAVAFLTCGCATIGLSEPTVQSTPLGPRRRLVPTDQFALTVTQEGTNLTASVTRLCDQMMQRDSKVKRTSERVNNTPGVDYAAAGVAVALIAGGVAVLADSAAVAERNDQGSSYNPVGPGGAKAIGGSLIGVGGLVFIIPIADAGRAAGTEVTFDLDQPPESVEKSGVKCGPIAGARVHLALGEEKFEVGKSDANGKITADLDMVVDQRVSKSEDVSVQFLVALPGGQASTVGAQLDFRPLFKKQDDDAWARAQLSCQSGNLARDCDQAEAYTRNYANGAHVAEAHELLRSRLPKLKAAAAEQAYGNLDIDACATGSKDQTADDADQACSAVDSFVSGYPESPHLEEVRAALAKGRERVAKIRKVEEAAAEREARRQAQEVARAEAQERLAAQQHYWRLFQAWRNDCTSECTMACSDRLNPLMCVNSCVNLRCSKEKFEQSERGW